mmetsp:Transcript_99522/g.281634  ORF Transcript_99522/g.281634 Transcript_99522/m.281634 type:complete len:296 (-) Transcript_99522:337-1224(-)
MLPDASSTPGTQFEIIISTVSARSRRAPPRAPRPSRKRMNRSMSRTVLTQPPELKPMDPPPDRTGLRFLSAHALSAAVEPSMRQSFRLQPLPSKRGSLFSFPALSRICLVSECPYIAPSRCSLLSGTENPVSPMSRGPKMRSRKKTSRGLPETTSTTLPRTSAAWLYSYLVPGSQIRGIRANRSAHSASDLTCLVSTAWTRSTYRCCPGASGSRAKSCWYPKPAVCVRRCRRVIGRFGGRGSARTTPPPASPAVASCTCTCLKAGRYFESSSSIASLPSSKRIMAATETNVFVVQ